MAEMLHDVMVTAGHVSQHHRRSRCATTGLPTSPSSGSSAAPLPSSPETGLTSHCESDKRSRGNIPFAGGD